MSAVELSPADANEILRVLGASGGHLVSVQALFNLSLAAEREESQQKSQPQPDGCSGYLVACGNAEPNGFQPVGWLYRGILSDIASRGLLHETGRGFVLSREGAERLRELGYELENGAWVKKSQPATK